MRRTTANPPIKGHVLLYEGKGRVEYEHTADGMQFTGNVLGGCECGAQPPDWPMVSIRATKRWHREHKAQLRAAGS